MLHRQREPECVGISCNVPGRSCWVPRKKYQRNFTKKSKILLLCTRILFPGGGLLLLPLDPPWWDHKPIRQKRIITIEEVLMSLAHLVPEIEARWNQADPCSSGTKYGRKMKGVVVEVGTHWLESWEIRLSSSMRLNLLKIPIILDL
jgi:hypothetical protein